MQYFGELAIPDPTQDERWEALARKLRRRQLERLTKGRLDVILDDLTLRELREDRHVTQQALARSAGSTQAHLSRLESRADMLVSSLGAYVAALGGKLDLIARLPHGAFRITLFKDGGLNRHLRTKRAR